MNIPNTRVPVEYYLCETKSEMKDWVYRNGAHNNFPSEFVESLIDLEWERLQSIKEVLEPYLKRAVDEVTE